MTSLLPNAEQQFVDGNGVPYAGGFVYFYEPGTTFPKDTWQDSGATILNTNPVILDSAGRSVIYGTGAYRQILKDSLGNTIWDKETDDLTSASVTGGPPSVLSATTSTPPGSPAVGDAYIIPPGATGAWTAYPTYVAIWTNAAAWSFEVPTQGWQTYVDDTANYAIFNGTSWETMMSFTDWSTATRIVDNFSGQPQPTPNMTVLVDPGAILNGTTLTQVGARLSANLTQGQTTVGGLESLTGLVSGLAVRGPGIAAGTTITVSGSTVTLSVGATTTITSAALVFAQVTSTITAPVSHPRIDRVVVDQTTGLQSVVTGSESANPSPPAIPSGKYPVCQVYLTTSTTAITRGMFTDERAWIYSSGANSYPGAESTIASATTTDLGTTSSYIVLVTGTTAITSFGSSASTSAPLYFLRFSGAPTITYNGTSLITPTSQNIVTTNGDTCVVEYLGSGNWKILSYQKINGQVLSMAGSTASIASATTCNIGSTKSNSVLITGTTTITSLGSSANVGNPIYFLRFSGILQLTYNATSLILPGSANITTAANDCAIAEYLGSGNWLVRDYEPAGGVTTTSAPTLVASGSLISTARLTVDVSGSYSSYEAVISGLTPATNAVSLLGFFREAGVTIGSNYQWSESRTQSTGGTAVDSNNSDSSFRIGAASSWNNSSQAGLVFIRWAPSTVAANPEGSAKFSSSYLSSASLGINTQGSAYNPGSGTDKMSGISISFSSGNIAWGNYSVYGYK